MRRHWGVAALVAVVMVVGAGCVPAPPSGNPPPLTLFPSDALTVPETPVDVLCVPVCAPWMRAAEGIDFARAVAAPRNLAIHDRIYSEAGLRIVEAAELVIGSTYHDEPGGLERFLGEHQLIAHRRPPRTYRPAAIPSRLLSQRGLVLRPLSISIEAAIRD